MNDESEPIRLVLAQLPRHEPPPGLRERLLAVVGAEANAEPVATGRVHQVRIAETTYGNTRVFRRFEQSPQSVTLPALAPVQTRAIIKYLSSTNNQNYIRYAVL